MKLYTLDNSIATTANAPHLMKKCNLEQKQPSSFLKRNCFSPLSQKDLKEGLVFFGQRGKDRIGNFDADQFVEKFVADFNKKFTKDDKLLLENICLIDCNSVTAVLIINKLYQLGFSNIRARMIVGASRVKVLNEQSIDALNEFEEQPGDIRAYKFTSTQQQAIFDLEKKVQEAEAYLAKKSSQSKSKLRNEEEKAKQTAAKSDAENKIINIEEQAGFSMISDIIAELDRPHNIFFPGDLKRSTPPKNQKQENALFAIELRRRQLVKQGKTEKAEILETLHEEVRYSTKEVDWKKLIKNFLDTYFNGVIAKIKSKTRSILMNILEDKPNNIIKTNKLQKNDALEKVVLAMPENMVIARNKIQLFIAVLEQEEKNRPSERLSLFFSLKRYKINQLKELDQRLFAHYNIHKKTDKIPDWSHIIDEFLAKTRLIRSIRSHRTRNLLKNIRAGMPKKGILDRNDPAEEWEPHDAKADPKAIIADIVKRTKRWW